MAEAALESTRFAAVRRTTRIEEFEIQALSEYRMYAARRPLGAAGVSPTPQELEGAISNATTPASGRADPVAQRTNRVR